MLCLSIITFGPAQLCIYGSNG